MKKSYRLKNLCCAGCAAKMEHSISKVAGVSSVSVNYILQRLTLDADDERFEDILNTAQKLIHKYESDCCIVR